MVAEVVTDCQRIYYIIDMSFERARQIRMRWAEVEGMEGVDGAFSGLIRLWKCVKKRALGLFLGG